MISFDDSGTEIKLAGAPLVDMKSLGLDARADLSTGTGTADMAAIMDRAPGGESSLRFSMVPLQFQEDESLVPLV